MKNQTVIIIPARNEADNLSRVLEDIRRHAERADVVVVNDNSNDATQSVLALFPEVRYLNPSVNLGIGGAVQLGIRYCHTLGYREFIRMDGDGQHPAGAIPALLGQLKDKVLVQGSRSHFIRSSNLLRKMGSIYFRFLFRVFCGKTIPDPTSGFMCFGRDLAAKFQDFFPSEFPEIETNVLLLRAGYDIVPVQVEMNSRMGGESSIKFFRGIIYMCSVTLAFFISFIRKNPYQQDGEKV